jgi:predicted GH43/DUF377 family glycosyl hydrolase
MPIIFRLAVLLLLVVPAMASCGRYAGYADIIPLDELLIDDQEIAPPALDMSQVAYNASMVQNDQDFLMAFRVDTRLGDANGPMTQQVAIMGLDPNLTPYGPHSVLNTPHEPGALPSAEDPRIIVLKGVPYVLYNAAVTTGVSPGRRMYIGRIAVDQSGGHTAYSLAHAKEILLAKPGVGQRTEKNWTPFIYNDALHIIHKTNPPLVFRVDLDTLLDPDADFAVAHYVSRSDSVVDFPFGEMRGGSQAIFSPELDQYIAIFHTRRSADFGYGRQMYYMMGAYTFDKEPPFAIRRMTREPIATPEAADAGMGATRIIFPQGLVDDGNRFLVSCGRNDASIQVLTFDKQALFDHLLPVD